MQIDRVTFTFTGQIPRESFAEFAQHRASRLSITLSTVMQNDAVAKLQVIGQRDLVDAFEMALSLGPQDCIVHEVTRQADNPAKGEET